MTLSESQLEMRSAFLGGFAGQMISGLIWAAAAALGQWVSPRYAMIFLFFGSMLIFPLTQAVLRLLGRPAKVSRENGLWNLGTQVAFTVPLNFLLVGAATLYRADWFFPAAMIVVGAHYLPFITLYGMRMFAVLAGLLVASGTALAFFGPRAFTPGGWLGAGLLIAFAFIGRSLVVREETRQAA